MRAPTAQRAMNNLRAALLKCHLKKISVSPFDVEFILHQIEDLPASQNENLTKESIICSIKLPAADLEQAL